jgi:hypothetical protein
LEAVSTDDSKRSIGNMDAHYVREALSFLQKPEAHAHEHRVARLEFSFLPLLDRQFLLPKMLQRQLAREPRFFVECLTLLYRPRGDGGEPQKEAAEKAKTTNEHERERARRLWQLLYEWRVIPGTNDQGVVDADALRAWVLEARRQAEAVRRLEVCDVQIGQVFARSPIDSDQGAPVVAIRDVLEECKSEEMERGFIVGLHNLRGAFGKSLYEGGNQERELATRYERYAQISNRWPRTARALRAVAKDYLRQAQQEDERAQARE